MAATSRLKREKTLQDSGRDDTWVNADLFILFVYILSECSACLPAGQKRAPQMTVSHHVDAGNTSPLQEQQVPLTTELALQSGKLHLFALGSCPHVNPKDAMIDSKHHDQIH